MCPERFVPRSYDSAKLAFLQQAFDEAWKEIEARYASRDRSQEEKTRTELAQIIVNAASEGEVEPENLRGLALRAMRQAGALPPKKLPGNPAQ